MKRKSLFIILFFAITIAFASLIAWKIWMAQDGVHKLLMPGRYRVSIKGGTLYEVWYFWTWPSKNVHEEFQNTEITFRALPDVDRDFPSYPGEKKTVFRNIGRAEFAFKSRKDSDVEVICQNKCVVVLVPTSSILYQPELDLDVFFGSFDDTHFETVNPLLPNKEPLQ